MKSWIIVLIFMSTTLFAGNWAINEKVYLEGFSELEEKQIISLKDSINSQPIAGAAVEVFGDVLYSDKNGYIKLPNEKLKGVVHQFFPIKVKKSGYRELNELIEVELESVTNKFFSMEKGTTQYAKLVISKKGLGTVYLNGKKLEDRHLKNLSGIVYGTYLLKRVSGKNVTEKIVVIDRVTKNLDI